MSPLGQVLLELADGLPEDAGGAASGTLLRVEAVELKVPVEARLAARVGIEGALPRNRLASGFDAPVCVLAARFVRVGA